MYERVRSFLFGGIEPSTTVTFVSSSAVPWPNALSLDPLGVSTRHPTFVAPQLIGKLAQSVPLFTTRLPSLPSNVLGARFALEPETKMTPTIATATSVAAIVHGRPLCRPHSAESFRVKTLTPVPSSRSQCR